MGKWWQDTHVHCPWGCGYLFDKGMTRIDPERGLVPEASQKGITACSRCKKACNWEGGKLTQLEELTLDAEDRAGLERVRALLRLVERQTGKVY